VSPNRTSPSNAPILFSSASRHPSSNCGTGCSFEAVLLFKYDTATPEPLGSSGHRHVRTCNATHARATVCTTPHTQCGFNSTQTRVHPRARGLQWQYRATATLAGLGTRATNGSRDQFTFHHGLDRIACLGLCVESLLTTSEGFTCDVFGVALTARVIRYTLCRRGTPVLRWALIRGDRHAHQMRAANRCFARGDDAVLTTTAVVIPPIHLHQETQ
jgi:hypothetical protein